MGKLFWASTLMHILTEVPSMQGNSSGWEDGGGEHDTFKTEMHP
jgi:hypothetical protein